jgi:hypothetical protein
MCPACVANAAMAVAGVSASAGGVTTIAMRVLRWKRKGKKLGLRKFAIGRN